MPLISAPFWFWSFTSLEFSYRLSAQRKYGRALILRVSSKSRAEVSLTHVGRISPSSCLVRRTMLNHTALNPTLNYHPLCERFSPSLELLQMSFQFRTLHGIFNPSMHSEGGFSLLFNSFPDHFLTFFWFPFDSIELLKNGLFQSDSSADDATRPKRLTQAELQRSPECISNDRLGFKLWGRVFRGVLNEKFSLSTVFTWQILCTNS